MKSVAQAKGLTGLSVEELIQQGIISSNFLANGGEDLRAFVEAANDLRMEVVINSLGNGHVIDDILTAYEIGADKIGKIAANIPTADNDGKSAIFDRSARQLVKIRDKTNANDIMRRGRRVLMIDDSDRGLQDAQVTQIVSRSDKGGAVYEAEPFDPDKWQYHLMCSAGGFGTVEFEQQIGDLIEKNRSHSVPVELSTSSSVAVGAVGATSPTFQIGERVGPHHYQVSFGGLEAESGSNPGSRTATLRRSTDPRLEDWVPPGKPFEAQGGGSSESHGATSKGDRPGFEDWVPPGAQPQRKATLWRRPDASSQFQGGGGASVSYVDASPDAGAVATMVEAPSIVKLSSERVMSALDKIVQAGKSRSANKIESLFTQALCLMQIDPKISFTYYLPAISAVVEGATGSGFASDGVADRLFNSLKAPKYEIAAFENSGRDKGYEEAQKVIECIRDGSIRASQDPQVIYDAQTQAMIVDVREGLDVDRETRIDHALELLVDAKKERSSGLVSKAKWGSRAEKQGNIDAAFALMGVSGYRDFVQEIRDSEMTTEDVMGGQNTSEKAAILAICKDSVFQEKVRIDSRKLAQAVDKKDVEPRQDAMKILRNIHDGKYKPSVEIVPGSDVAQASSSRSLLRGGPSKTSPR